MKHYDLLVIGFGKAGKTLAAKVAAQGKKVALVEENAAMYGGTCINIGCIPTKTLIHAADKGWDFAHAMAEKEAVTSRLRQKNYDGVAAVADVYLAKARFVADKTVEITANGETEQLSGDVVVINTGATSVVPNIKGLADSKNVFDSTGIQQLAQQPQRLGIIGGGNIGLEFASLYARLGSKVSVFEPNNRILPREEADIAELAQKYLQEQGVAFELGAQILEVSNRGEEVVVTTANGEYVFDALLYATGRKPNTADLNLQATHIELTERGAVKVNEFCETSVENVFAVGDVNGGLQFTYVSLDDFRIVFDYLNGKRDYTLNSRKNVPTVLFIDPPLARVGISAEEAKAKGLNVLTKELPLAAIPKAHVNSDLRGKFKAVVDADSKLILGATLFGAEGQELINLIKLAMDCNIPYTQLQRQVYSHPSMAESFNDLFAF